MLLVEADTASMAEAVRWFRALAQALLSASSACFELAETGGECAQTQWLMSVDQRDYPVAPSNLAIGLLRQQVAEGARCERTRLNP